MKTLYLPLKKQWYEMIERGEKREEYRECKQYWEKRLIDFHPDNAPIQLNFIKAFDRVCFSYGYTKRRMTFECDGITIGKGRTEWGAPDDEVFIIKLGSRIA